MRHALGDGATEAQARNVLELLRRAGLLDAGGVSTVVGVAEIAEQAGVTPPAVCQWPDLPPPLVHLKCGRIWDGRVIEQYLAARQERLNPPPCEHDFRTERHGDRVCMKGCGTVERV